MTPEEQAKQIVGGLLTRLAGDYNLEFSDTDAADAISECAAALQAEGDEREREALERAASVVESYHFSAPQYVANRVRSLIKESD